MNVLDEAAAFFDDATARLAAIAGSSANPLELAIVFPNTGAINHWSQTGDPLTTLNPIDTFTPFRVDEPGTIASNQFAGLTLSTSSAIWDGIPSTQSYYAIGVPYGSIHSSPTTGPFSAMVDGGGTTYESKAEIWALQCNANCARLGPEVSYDRANSPSLFSFPTPLHDDTGSWTLAMAQDSSSGLRWPDTNLDGKGDFGANNGDINAAHYDNSAAVQSAALLENDPLELLLFYPDLGLWQHWSQVSGWLEAYPGAQEDYTPYDIQMAAFSGFAFEGLRQSSSGSKSLLDGNTQSTNAAFGLGVTYGSQHTSPLYGNFFAYRTAAGSYTFSSRVELWVGTCNTKCGRIGPAASYTRDSTPFPGACSRPNRFVGTGHRARQLFGRALARPQQGRQGGRARQRWRCYGCVC